MNPENTKSHQQTTSQSGETVSQLEFGYEDTFNPIFNDIEPNVVINYMEYIIANPMILVEFRKEAMQQIQMGKTHLRSKLLLEILRDKMELETKGTFKINNSFSGCLARHIIMIDPSFKEYFELRSKNEGPNNVE